MAIVVTDAFRAMFGDAAPTSWRRPPPPPPTPAAGLVTDDDYTALVEFLAGPQAAMIKGQVIFVNGGQN